jgi:hypothetical protein
MRGFHTAVTRPNPTRKAIRNSKGLEGNRKHHDFEDEKDNHQRQQPAYSPQELPGQSNDKGSLSWI